MIKRLYILSFFDGKDYEHTVTAWTERPTKDEIQLAIEDDGYMSVDPDDKNPPITNTLGWVYTNDRRTGYRLTRVVEGRAFRDADVDLHQFLIT